MKHLSLFSGIGGLDLAAEWAGFETVAFVERDPYCQRVLAKRWPGVPCFDDVRAINPDSLRLRQLQPEGREPDERGRSGDVGDEITVVSGGFPCQPHSVAGKRQASADDRDLWPEFARVIREIRPRWVVAENVPGLLHSESGRFFGRVLGDLADMGYSAGWGVWGAADVGALHRRERVFIVAYAAWDVQPERAASGAERERVGQRGESGDVADAGGSRLAERVVLAGVPGDQGRGDAREDAALGREAMGDAIGEWQLQPSGCESEERGRPCDASWWEFEPDVGRVAHGVPSRVDRLRALGNAVVPQQAYPLFKAIAELEGMKQQSNRERSR